MFTRRYFVAAILSTTSVLAANGLRAADTQAVTIQVHGMHCAGCAAKVTRKLQAVDGVLNAQVDAARGEAVVSAKANVVPSDRALWEAVEKAGYKPTKLIGPSGIFTVKPKS